MPIDIGNSRDGGARLYSFRKTQHDQLDRVEAEIREILGESKPCGTPRHRSETRDQDAINNERVFIRRFGFDWPRTDRIGVIALKHRLDLTDREIRLLKLTYNLSRRNGVVRLASTRWAAIFGRCLTIFVLVEFASALLLQALVTHHALSGLQAAKLCGVTTFILAMLWLIHLGYIKPWIIEQRVMKKTASGAS